jgi:hypothetical protein
VRAKGTKKRGHRLTGVVRLFYGCLQLGQLQLAESQKDVIFAGEVIEKGAFTNVGGVGDVFDGSLRKTFSRKGFEGGAEQAFADFRATTLAPVSSGKRGWSAGS